MGTAAYAAQAPKTSARLAFVMSVIAMANRATKSAIRPSVTCCDDDAGSTAMGRKSNAAAKRVVMNDTTTWIRVREYRTIFRDGK
ncbi:hypothetical protein RRF57_011802 [Xylaria bambusicola]|uniref:Uncharacterized protein n=1 Tax=Xylaria bambusicola TaxID=326684 RepID=A0AAN7UNG0_9PEZI